MSEPLPTVFVIGAGPVGTALCMALTKVNVDVLGIFARREAIAGKAAAMAKVAAFSGAWPKEIARADVVIVAVKDEAIATVAGALRAAGALSESAVLLQCAGSVSSEDSFGGIAGHATMHPLCAVPDAQSGADRFAKTYFGVEGDATGRAAALALVSALGGTPLLLTADKMAAYHAAAVLASNHVVALLAAASELLAEAGVAESHRLPALTSLSRGALNSVTAAGNLTDALTGPVARGDPATVERHLQALASRPELLELYRRLSVRTLEIAREKASATAENLDQLEQVLLPKRR